MSFIDEVISDYDVVQEMVFPKEPTMAQGLQAHLTKILVLACASYYEQELSETLKQYFEAESKKYGDAPHRFVFDKKEFSVYKLFEYGRINDTNSIDQLPEFNNLIKGLGRFGEGFKKKILVDIEEDAELEKQSKSFQEIFAIRNLFAHQTYVELTSNQVHGKSFQDITQLHKDAEKFVEYLKGKFCRRDE